jgi:bacteriorhodopsin
VRRKKRVGNWIWLVLLLVLLIAALVFLEWMGSEQPQKVYEKTVALPSAPLKTE